MPLANLVDRCRLRREGHELRRPAPDPPARVIRMHPLRLRQTRPQSPVCLADGAVCPPQRVLRQRSLRYSCTGQCFQDGRHLALRDALSIVQGMARGQDPRSQPMRRRAVLVRCQVRMASPHPPPTGLAVADGHLILPHHRPRLRGYVGDGGDLHPVLDQDSATVRARHLRHRYRNRRLAQCLHCWRGPVRERPLARLAARPLGVGRWRLPAEGRGLSVLAALHAFQFGSERDDRRLQLAIAPFQRLDTPQQFPRVQRGDPGRLA